MYIYTHVYIQRDNELRVPYDHANRTDVSALYVYIYMCVCECVCTYIHMYIYNVTTSCVSPLMTKIEQM